MKNHRVLAICMAIMLPTVLQAQDELEGSFVFEDEERSYILYIPETYEAGEEAPLLFNFHGYGSNAEEQMNYGDFREIADTAGFLLCHPEGLTDGIGMTHWNVGWGFSTNDDVGFISALLDTLAANYSVDPDRVYSTGMSNGGFMSYHLACNLSDRIAAIASVTGSMSTVTLNACDPSHPTPILQIHGTEDGVVPYNGFLFGEPIDDVLDYWIEYNSNATEAVSTEIPDINTEDGSTAELFVYGDGNCGVETRLTLVTGGEHTWPGTEIVFSGTNLDFSASEAVWNFVSQYNLQDLSCVTGLNEWGQTGISIFPNPSSGQIRVEGGSSGYLEILDQSGRLVLKQEAWDGKTLDVSQMASGIYILRSAGLTARFVKE